MLTGESDTPEWRNWQTRQVEGLVTFTGRAGSSPVSGTLKGKDLQTHLSPYPSPFYLGFPPFFRRPGTYRAFPHTMAERSLVMLGVRKKGDAYYYTLCFQGRCYYFTVGALTEEQARAKGVEIAETLDLTEHGRLTLSDQAAVDKIDARNARAAAANRVVRQCQGSWKARHSLPRPAQRRPQGWECSARIERMWR
jgi:hypothetical protein